MQMDIQSALSSCLAGHTLYPSVTRSHALSRQLPAIRALLLSSQNAPRDRYVTALHDIATWSTPPLVDDHKSATSTPMHPAESKRPPFAVGVSGPIGEHKLTGVLSHVTVTECWPLQLKDEMARRDKIVIPRLIQVILETCSFVTMVVWDV
jgi:hypothetical protein